MNRDALTELHYITPLANVSSICKLGILSHQKARNRVHDSVAMPEIQEKRSQVIVPGGRRLHEYANLYICARNPMLRKRRDQHDQLCVLRVSPSVLDLRGVVISDQNASSSHCRFVAAPAGLSIVNQDLTFAEFWTDPDPITAWRCKSAKCAEVLVPDRVDPRFLMGAYVSCEEAQRRFAGMGVFLVASIDRHLFFL